MRPLEMKEWKALYRFVKTVLYVCGAILIGYGAWFLITGLITAPSNIQSLFGIFPAYVGSMMILIGIAMKLEWFTNARRFW